MNTLPEELFYYIARFVPDERDLLLISREFYQLALELPDVKIWRKHWPDYGESDVKMFIITYGNAKMAELITPAESDIDTVVKCNNINVINRYLDEFQDYPLTITRQFFISAWENRRENLALVKHLMNRIRLWPDDIITLAWCSIYSDAHPAIRRFMLEYLESRK